MVDSPYYLFNTYLFREKSWGWLGPASTQSLTVHTNSSIQLYSEKFPGLTRPSLHKTVRSPHYLFNTFSFWEFSRSWLGPASTQWLTAHTTISSIHLHSEKFPGLTWPSLHKTVGSPHYFVNTFSFQEMSRGWLGTILTQWLTAHTISSIHIYSEQFPGLTWPSLDKTVGCPHYLFNRSSFQEFSRGWLLAQLRHNGWSSSLYL